MNSLASTQPVTASYRTTAQSTRNRRQAAGKYPTVAQKLAAGKLINQGVASLSVDELEVLSKHPYFTGGQRSEYAILAKRMR